MAFYTKREDTLTKAENNVFGPGYDLLAFEHETYSYPVHGWYWFDTDEEAEAQLGGKLPGGPAQTES